MYERYWAFPMQRYRIYVEGGIPPGWSDSMGGLAISLHEQPAGHVVTELSGLLADQCALHGVLDTLFMLNLPVLRVEREPEGK